MNSSTEQEQALAVLKQAVEERYESGRRTLGASLKPELLRRTNGGFDEKTLGYSAFGDFVRHARDLDVVDIYAAPTGPDMEVVPKGKEPLPTAPRPSSPASDAYIRRDLWRAFIDWTPGLTRLYDREVDQVVEFPTNVAPLEPEDVRRKREAWAADGERYVEIHPLTMEDQIVWMKEFAEQEQGPIKLLLDFALTRDRPFREFSQAVRGDYAASRSWQTFRKDKLISRIEDWKTSNEVELSIFSALKDTALEVTKHAAGTAVVDAADTDAVRKRMHEVVDRMSVADLLRLSVPAEYWIDR